MAASTHYVMGIDGGGTKTEAWLACIETGSPYSELEIIDMERLVLRTRGQWELISPSRT